ncbi:MAG TPA: DUF2461 domain-containing protein [Bacteroidales bacterium]|nr:DUF2461 domain-containing protein [Bacteroidales bacterium]
MEPIKKSTFDFLKDLKKNNEREWFLENKPRYLEAKQNFEGFAGNLLGGIIKFEPIMKGLEVSSCVYRINRDIRFSNDKSPYKTHLGAFMVRGGRQNGDRYAGYYFHIEPGNNSMIAGGAYMPPADRLAAIREKIDEDGDKLVRILKNKDFAGMFGEIEGEKLKTAPKGYPKDHPHIDLLRLKSFLVVRMLKDSEVTSPECLDLVLKACRLMKPLNDFLNEA